MIDGQAIYIFLLLLSVFISSISQVMLKKSAIRKYNTKIAEYLNPLVIIAYALFFGTTVLTVMAYRKVPLSLGPVLETTSYAYVTFFGIKIFKEKLNIMKIVSLMLIIVGIIIYSL